MNLHKSQIMNHKSVFMSCTSSKYCLETFHSPSEPVSNVTNQRLLWQSASYTPTLAAGLTRYNLFSFLGQEVETKHVAEGTCLQGKKFLPTEESYITCKRRCVTGICYKAWHCLLPGNNLKLVRVCTRM